MVANSDWQNEEILYLTANYGKASKITILKTLKNRTWQAIVGKAKRLKITKHREEWTKKDKETLRKVFPLLPKNRVLEVFPNRPWASIQVKASKLKIHRMRSLEYVKGKLQNGTISDFERGYLAGIIDGEGSINLHRYKNTFSMKVEVTNTYVPLRDIVHELAGGKITHSKHGGERKEAWTVYHCSAVAILDTLRQIESNLIVKRQQALLMIEFCQNRIAFPQGLYTNRDFEISTIIHKLNGKKPFSKGGA